MTQFRLYPSKGESFSEYLDDISELTDIDKGLQNKLRLIHEYFPQTYKVRGLDLYQALKRKQEYNAEMLKRHENDPEVMEMVSMEEEQILATYDFLNELKEQGKLTNDSTVSNDVDEFFGRILYHVLLNTPDDILYESLTDDSDYSNNTLTAGAWIR